MCIDVRNERKMQRYREDVIENKGLKPLFGVKLVAQIEEIPIQAGYVVMARVDTVAVKESSAVPLPRRINVTLGCRMAAFLWSSLVIAIFVRWFNCDLQRTRNFGSIS